MVGDDNTDMKMISGGGSGRANVANDLALYNILSRFNVPDILMHVFGIQTAAMINDGIVAAAAVPAICGKHNLSVKNGEMTIHIVMPSKNIVNLFYGLAEDAKKDGAKLIEPTVEKVKYSDGTEEEVYAFDIPVPYLDKEFDCALVGTKGKWYDHKVSVSNPEAIK